MTTVDDIKMAISHLSDEALQELRVWYEHFDAERWDAQLEIDIAAGRLDALADEALLAFRTGNTTEL